MTTCFKLNFCECPPKNHQQLVAVTKVSSHHLSAVTHNQQNQILEHPVFIGDGGCADFSRFVFSNVDVFIGCNQETESNIGYLYWLQSRSGSGSNIGGPDDGAVPKSHAYSFTNTSTALIDDASD